MAAIEIENNIKYGLTRSHFSWEVFQQDSFEIRSEFHVGVSNSNQHVGFPIVVNNNVGIFNLKTCEDGVSLL